MAFRISKAVRNFILQNGSLKQALQNGKLMIYSGSQPATPETVATGTLLCTITNNSGSHTSEVLSTGTVTLSTGAAGSVDTVTVNGMNILTSSVPFNTSLTQTAADVAAAINMGMSDPEYTATSSGDVVTISAVRGTGATPNGYVVSGTFTTITGSYANMAGGVAPVNGLQFQNASGGSMSKSASQTWSGVCAVSGTAGFFRYVGSVADSGVTDSTESQFRLDGSVGTSGADLNLTSTAFAAGATETVKTFDFTAPES